MASTFKSDYAKGIKIMPTPGEHCNVSVRMAYTISAALVINDILYLGDLPPRYEPFDCILDATDVDTGGSPAITLSAGFLNADQTDLSGTAWIVDSTVGQAGGMARPATNTLCKTTATDTRRPFGVKVTTAPATGATTGTIGLTLIYRPGVS